MGETFPGQKISSTSRQRRRSGLAHEEGLDVPERLQREKHPPPQPHRRTRRQHRPQQRRQPPAACAAVLQEERVAEEVGEGERDEPEAPRPARAQGGGGRLERVTRALPRGSTGLGLARAHRQRPSGASQKRCIVCSLRSPSSARKHSRQAASAPPVASGGSTGSPLAGTASPAGPAQAAA